MLDLGDARCDFWVGLSNTSNDIQPGSDSPQTILLADMIATSTKRFFPTDRKLICIEQSTEELPAGRNLIAVQALCLGYKVDSSRRRHTARKAIDAVLFKVWD